MSQKNLGPIPDRSPITQSKALRPYLQNVIPQPFGDLPDTVQIAIIYWMAVIGEAWGQDSKNHVWRAWSYGGGEPGDKKKALAAIKKWRAKFVVRYAEELVCFTHVPAEALLLAAAEFSSTESLQRRYNPDYHFGTVTHGYNWPDWPVALCAAPEACDLLIQNGVSRLRVYIANDEQAVPVYWFPTVQVKDEKDCDAVLAAEPAPADDTVIGSGLSDRSLNLAIEYVCKLASLQGYTKSGETALFWHLTGVIEGHRQANSVDRVRP
jgi:hypothetical protein